ncbi:hypothetical protein DFA_00775 [Cavenderia fasciculata]|uniref:Uncharacterized protein n=1 Tax=Cavenderia fasciculata TaxID=261658 RepID=F4PTS9_CACFS|nr:uncharacterized protein DFA_00775 [Cavenderia fasciculata]EGG20908.1 hypothetical protein DFA_00775 [Cavenderia fasciculata]|eukprot:XP_004358758.1 hypothetical protein DFA_00775 [Cavenderia fasciculata]
MEPQRNPNPVLARPPITGVNPITIPMICPQSLVKRSPSAFTFGLIVLFLTNGDTEVDENIFGIGVTTYRTSSTLKNGGAVVLTNDEN